MTSEFAARCPSPRGQLTAGSRARTPGSPLTRSRGQLTTGARLGPTDGLIILSMNRYSIVAVATTIAGLGLAGSASGADLLGDAHHFIHIVLVNWPQPGR